jgi:hypothetical protein
VLADPNAAALLALALLAVVWAEKLPVAVPAHCTAGIGTTAATAAAAAAAATAATIVVAGASASAAAVTADAADATGVPLQPVDQLLFLPGLRQSRLRAEHLQVRDGLRTHEFHTERISRGATITGSRMAVSTRTRLRAPADDQTPTSVCTSESCGATLPPTTGLSSFECKYLASQALPQTGTDGAMWSVDLVESKPGFGL